MVPHQIYQALSQQRSHELKVNARRHEPTSAAEVGPANPSKSWSRLKNVVASLATLVRPSTRTATSSPASSAPTAKSTARSTAGPMGCVA